MNIKTNQWPRTRSGKAISIFPIRKRQKKKESCFCSASKFPQQKSRPRRDKKFGSDSFGLRLCPKGRRRGTHGRRPLESTVACLLVDVAIALALLAVLEEHGGADDEEGVDADHTEHGGENVVDEDVGETRDRGGAALLECGGGRARALNIGDEGRRRAVEVSAALELACVSPHSFALQSTRALTAVCMSS